MTDSRFVAVVLMCALAACAASEARALDMSGSVAVVLSDGVTGEMGVGVLSRGVASGSTVPWVQAGVGAVAVLGDVNSTWGPRALQMLRDGVKPEAVSDSLRELDPGFPSRQVGLLDREGRPGGFTGPLCTGWSGGILNYGVAVQGNTMPGAEPLKAMYDSSGVRDDSPLAERLLKALRAVSAHDGAGPGLRSAALLVGRINANRPEDASRFVYLRVDDHADPLAELERLYALYVPAQVVRARLSYVATYRQSGGHVGPERASREIATLRREVERALSDTRVGAPELNAMAWALAGDSAFAPAAARAVARARELAPKSPEVLDTAAELAARRGSLDEAVRLAREALALRPGDIAYTERLRTFEAALSKGSGKK